MQKNGRQVEKNEKYRDNLAERGSMKGFKRIGE